MMRRGKFWIYQHCRTPNACIYRGRGYDADLFGTVFMWGDDVGDLVPFYLFESFGVPLCTKGLVT